MNHALALDIPDTLNTCVLAVNDRSGYAAIPFTCSELEITVPGFTYPIEFDDLPAGFSINLTACELNVQSSNCGVEYNDLPDGIYIVRWSGAPNQSLYVEYNHLRITKALAKWQKAICSLDLKPCEPSVDLRENMENIYLIRMGLYAAKTMVEYCHKPEKGIDLYHFWLNKLNKINCEIC